MIAQNYMMFLSLYRAALISQLLSYVYNYDDQSCVSDSYYYSRNDCLQTKQRHHTIVEVEEDTGELRETEAAFIGYKLSG